MNRETKALRRLATFLGERRYVSYRPEEVRAMKRASHKALRWLSKRLVAVAKASLAEEALGGC